MNLTHQPPALERTEALEASIARLSATVDRLDHELATTSGAGYATDEHLSERVDGLAANDALMRAKIAALEEFRAQVDQPFGIMRAVAEGAIGERLDLVDADVSALRDYLENFKTEVRTAATVWNQAILERSRNAEESATIQHLRRVIKVIALTEIIASGFPSRLPMIDREQAWEGACAELFRRWGHLTMPDGTPMWSKPPTVSDDTKAMIAGALRLRQEAPNA